MEAIRKSSQNSCISGILQQTFLDSKPNIKWRPILDLNHIFQGSSLPYPKKPTIHEMHTFHVQIQSFQFKALLFGLSTALIEFNMLVKEVKQMAQNKAIKIHQYLDDWLVRATSTKPVSRRFYSYVSGTWFDVKNREIRSETQTNNQFCELPV